MAKILKFKISLSGIRPLIWRRLEVPADLSLHSLHDVMQEAMG